MEFYVLCFVGKDDTVLLPAHLEVAVVGEWNPHHQNQNVQNGQKDLIKKAHGPGHLTRILLEMLVRKPKGKYKSLLVTAQSPANYSMGFGNHGVGIFFFLFSFFFLIIFFFKISENQRNKLLFWVISLVPTLVFVMIQV